MQINVIKAVQAHWVPATPRPARGPFPPELLAKALPVQDEPDEHDCPPGWTVQSDFSQTQILYRCTVCEAVLREDELEGHVCD